MISILIVEDDKLIGEAIHQWFQGDYPADWVRSLAEARAQLEQTRYDIILLDLGLPDGDGASLLGYLQRNRHESGVLILTAYGDMDRRISGLDSGADDYLVKPINFNELDARIRAVHRRHHQIKGSIIEHGKFQLDLDGNTLTCNGEPVHLSHMEISIVTILMQGRGRYFSKGLLEDRLYSEDKTGAGNAIEVHISALRKKLGKSLIRTTRGLGYIIAKESADR